MATYFFDSSGLVKRYVPETGSIWVKGLTDPSAGNLVYVARITGAEVISAVTRRQRRGQIAVSDASTALLAFRRDFPAALPVIEITPIVIA